MDSMFPTFRGGADTENNGRAHPAAAQGSYSRVVSSSKTGSSDEHQLDKNSPCDDREKIATKTSV